MAKKVKLLKNIFIHPKSLFLILLVTAAIVITTVTVELSQSKSEMLALMEKQGHTLLETILISSQQALISYNKIESEVKQRLLGDAVMIKLLYEKRIITNNMLNDIAKMNNIYRINIFNSNGEKIFRSSNESHTGIAPKNDPQDYLTPIFEGDADTIFIGVKPARFLDEQRYAVAIATEDRGAIVINIKANELLSFRKKIGFGVLLRNVTENKQIIYAALQDDKGIIAGSGKVDHLEDVDSSSFLKQIVSKNQYNWRIIENSEKRVFELLHPFVYEDKVIGIFRLGLSLEPLDKISEKLTQRLLILGVIFIVFGFITITMIFIRQNLDLLSKKFNAIESYSTQIIENVSDSILVIDMQGIIKSINSSAIKLFNFEKEHVVGNSFSKLFLGSGCALILNDESTIKEIECTIDNSKRILLSSKSSFVDENREENVVLVIRDLTELKKLEGQIIRNEKLTAMGELASSVAHEIRNPLNSIGTITQQLGKDFVPAENNEEYKKLTNIVYKEVRRINETIESFLKFAKPQPIKPERFSFSELLEQIESQYKEVFMQKSLVLNINNTVNRTVIWDKKQISQVFINLIENSLDSLRDNGSLSILAKETENNSIEIIFSDSGKGISTENLKRIFNLYFTTKTKGSGIGLSIVQQIISEHNGTISVDSLVGKGTTFTIQLPFKI